MLLAHEADAAVAGVASEREHHFNGGIEGNERSFRALSSDFEEGEQDAAADYGAEERAVFDGK